MNSFLLLEECHWIGGKSIKDTLLKITLVISRIWSLVVETYFLFK